MMVESDPPLYIRSMCLLLYPLREDRGNTQTPQYFVIAAASQRKVLCMALEALVFFAMSGRIREHHSSPHASFAFLGTYSFLETTTPKIDGLDMVGGDGANTPRSELRHGLSPPDETQSSLCW